MRSGVKAVEVQVPCEEAFDLIHDYPRRLDWDPFLRSAYLLGDASDANVGVTSRCTARWAVGGFSMETRYVSFNRPGVAAVAMTSGPGFLRSFAASIRHEAISAARSRVTYRYRFVVAPRWLAWVIEPIVGWVFHRETTQRLQALKRYLEMSA